MAVDTTPYERMWQQYLDRIARERAPRDQYMMGNVVTSTPPKEWQMFDVPLTLSVAAPCAAAAEEYARQWTESDRCTLYRSGTPCYDRDHIFVDGDARLCDCQGH